MQRSEIRENEVSNPWISQAASRLPATRLRNLGFRGSYVPCFAIMIRLRILNRFLSITQSNQRFKSAKILSRTSCPDKVTIGMPPPGLTLPPTKYRLLNSELRCGILKPRFLKRSATTP